MDNTKVGMKTETGDERRAQLRFTLRITLL
jgi:hypothetical protein